MWSGQLISLKLQHKNTSSFKHLEIDPKSVKPKFDIEMQWNDLPIVGSWRCFFHVPQVVSGRSPSTAPRRRCKRRPASPGTALVYVFDERFISHLSPTTKKNRRTPQYGLCMFMSCSCWGSSKSLGGPLFFLPLFMAVGHIIPSAVNMHRVWKDVAKPVLWGYQ